MHMLTVLLAYANMLAVLFSIPQVAAKLSLLNSVSPIICDIQKPKQWFALTTVSSDWKILNNLMVSMQDRAFQKACSLLPRPVLAVGEDAQYPQKMCALLLLLKEQLDRSSLIVINGVYYLNCRPATVAHINLK